MRSFTLLTALFFSLTIFASAQNESVKKDPTQKTPDKSSVPAEPEKTASEKPEVTKVTEPDKKPSPDVSKNVDKDSAKNKNDDDKVGLTDTGYVRPDAKKRFKTYVDNVVGPFAWVRYTASAGVLTWRNSPEEWGDKWEGFGRRVANSLGKSAIRNTTIYALDEALKYDSNFYRSRDRSVAARLRNSVFSAVTARNKEGKRVVGVPRLVGNFTSEIISSTTWYPPRYDLAHGVKGGAISIGINVGFNLVREFIWKK